MNAALKQELTQKYNSLDSLDSAYGLDAFLKGYEYALMMGGKES